MENENKNQEDFQHGYTSGVEGVEKQVYEGYLSSKVSQDWVLERLSEKKNELIRTELNRREAGVERKTTFARLQEQAAGMNQAAALVNSSQAAIALVDSETEQLKTKRTRKAGDYSLFAGIIFFLAGVSFIAGDLIISHEIVAYALNIRNNNEAWAFAVGLAMVSILLKPAYDRLVEGPYLTDDSPKAKNRYGRFKLILGIFAIVTLVVLGWFRYEAYRTDKMKEAINKSIKNIQLNAVDPVTGAPVNTPEITNQIEKALRDSDQLNLNLVNSPWALLSFVLSGVLFAIAGAVSLGMGLPVLQDYWYRWLQIDPRLGRLRRRRRKLMKLLAEQENDLNAKTAQKNISENELALLPSLEELKAETERLRAEIESLEDERKLAVTDTRIQSFGDGYSHGEIARNLMSEEEMEQWKNSHFTVSNLAHRAKSSSLDRAATRTKSSGMRPHQAIRKVITDRFDEDTTN